MPTNPLSAAYQKSAPSPGGMLYGGRQRVFPTKHPMGKGDLANSNVLMMGVNLSGREYVVPTMIDGKQVTPKDAVARARKEGVHNYPSFKTEPEATAYAEREHGNINADGFMKPKPRPSIAAATLPLTRARSWDTKARGR